MSVILLFNTFGETATAAANAGTATTSTGFSDYNVISGPRSLMVKAVGGNTHFIEFTAASQAVTHVVIARYDLFRNAADSTELQIEYDAIWDNQHTISDPDTPTAIGPTNQDIVLTIPRTTTKLRATFINTGSTNGFMYSKVYWSNSFTFGREPQKQLEIIDKEERVMPAFGYGQYMTEKKIRIKWSNVTQAKMAAFRALPVGHPFFIYDESGDIIAHQLEHVIIAQPWQERRRGIDLYDMDMTVHRLKHYD